MSDATADPPPEPATQPRETGLEDRVRRLETELAERPVLDADAVADRVVAKLSALAEARSTPDSDRVLVLDAAVDPAPPAPLVPVAPAPPQGTVLHPPTPPTDPKNRKWFLTQLWAEIRLIVRMYLDPHYRVSRTTQFALPGIGLLLVFNYFFFSVWVDIAFVSPVTERLLAVVLSILGYKLLTRETARYRGVLDYLSRYSPR